MFRGRAKKLHFVGIGGIGMSGIAEVLFNLGFDVRGSDLQASATTRHLSELGVRIWLGHRPEHVSDADVVVVSSAVSPSNPEVQQARAQQIPIIPRAEMLAELMRLKYGVAVAGTHGKTTTTSLIATLLTDGGLDPTIVIGGRLKSIRSNARLGSGEYLVAEADESDGSFLSLTPTVAVVTNIDVDHVDHWQGGLVALQEAFARFLARLPFYGMAVLCLDHPVVQSLLPNLKKRHVTYGFSPQADYGAEEVVCEPDATSFVLRRRGERIGPVKVGLIGRHNVLNTLASLAVADELGIPPEKASRALKSFGGIARRFEHKGDCASVRVVDDYGHHPEEIRVTLEAARQAFPERRLVVAFQPHRYSRLAYMMDDFAAAFNACHSLVLTDVYAAGETPLPNVSSTILAERVRERGHRDVSVVHVLEDVAVHLFSHIKPNDLVLTLGAGTIWRTGEQLLALLRAREEA